MGTNDGKTVENTEESYDDYNGNDNKDCNDW